MRSRKIFSKATVIGNGESRLPIDIDNISATKIGCNAIIRHHFVDVCVCVDKKMLRECIQYQVNCDTIYTRKEYTVIDSKFVRALPSLFYHGQQRSDNTQHWGSGPYALLLAAGLYNRIQIIGFDLYSSTAYVNNCYKGSENYNMPTKRAVDPRYWIYQTAKVIEHFSDTEFEIYQTDDWTQPESWKLPNVSVDTISNFQYT